ncbi:MAG TPA: iron export ABC transporter permease subunit FetB [Myxococcaceae bacterium]|nr:iron export ABC transporter permease subunit FetB [Myxococcaceae bacterium]
MSYVSVSFPQLALSLGLMALAIAVSRQNRLGLEKDLAIGTLRAAVQLFAVGLLLTLVFQHEGPASVFAVVGVMVLVGGWTAARRIAHGPGTGVLFRYATLAVFIAGACVLVPVFSFVIRPARWYEARFLIPISGMILSNAMNGVALVFERVFASIHDDAAAVEQLLSLGASPRQAVDRHVRAAMNAALRPTINGLLTVGLVALPGMMTGQIVSGTAPDQAVRYQLVIMYQLVAVAAVAGALAARFARRLSFTDREQLRAFVDRRVR